MPLKTTSGRATHGGTPKNSILIASHHRCESGRSHERSPDSLYWNAGRFYWVSGANVKQITQGEALERFARFYTDEYFEGTSDRAELLLSPGGAATARGVNREIERQSKGWSVGKRLRMAMTFESWAKHLRGGAR